MERDPRPGWAGTDVLLTTQYLDEADHLASQIVIIDHGRAVAAGTPAQLKQRIGGNVIEVHVRDSRDVASIAELLAGSATVSRGSTRPPDGSACASTPPATDR